MRIQTIIVSLIFSIFSLAAIAGAGHDHGHSHAPVSQSQAERVATENVVRLADSGKIDASWKATAVMNTEKKNFGGELEWVVTFKNEKIDDREKQTLYIFLTMDGKYLAANYTGN